MNNKRANHLEQEFLFLFLLKIYICIPDFAQKTWNFILRFSIMTELEFLSTQLIRLDKDIG